MITVQLTLGSTLKYAREASGLSVRDLAKKAGISPAQVSQIEGGSRKSPGFMSIARIAEALSLSLDDVASAAGIRGTTAGTPVPPFPAEEIRRIGADAARASARADALLAVFEKTTEDFSN